LTVDDDLKNTANTIIELFKLGADLKKDYPLILEMILDLEKDQNFFLQYFSEKIKNDLIYELQIEDVLPNERQ
jgi:hypothetical protein